MGIFKHKKKDEEMFNISNSEIKEFIHMTYVNDVIHLKIKGEDDVRFIKLNSYEFSWLSKNNELMDMNKSTKSGLYLKVDSSYVINYIQNLNNKGKLKSISVSDNLCVIK